jgi:protease II
MISNKYKNTAKLASMSISDDHQYIAFGVDLLSNESLVFMVMDISKSQVLQEKFFDVSNIKFSADSNYLYYTVHDDVHWVKIII